MVGAPKYAGDKFGTRGEYIDGLVYASRRLSAVLPTDSPSMRARAGMDRLARGSVFELDDGEEVDELGEDADGAALPANAPAGVARARRRSSYMKAGAGPGLLGADGAQVLVVGEGSDLAGSAKPGSPVMQADGTRLEDVEEEEEGGGEHTHVESKAPEEAAAEEMATPRNDDEAGLANVTDSSDDEPAEQAKVDMTKTTGPSIRRTSVLGAVTRVALARPPSRERRRSPLITGLTGESGSLLSEPSTSSASRRRPSSISDGTTNNNSNSSNGNNNPAGASSRPRSLASSMDIPEPGPLPELELPSTSPSPVRASPSPSPARLDERESGPQPARTSPLRPPPLAPVRVSPERDLAADLLSPSSDDLFSPSLEPARPASPSHPIPPTPFERRTAKPWLGGLMTIDDFMLRNLDTSDPLRSPGSNEAADCIHRALGLAPLFQSDPNEYPPLLRKSSIDSPDPATRPATKSPRAASPHSPGLPPATAGSQALAALIAASPAPPPPPSGPAFLSRKDSGPTSIYASFRISALNASQPRHPLAASKIDLYTRSLAKEDPRVVVLSPRESPASKGAAAVADVVVRAVHSTVAPLRATESALDPSDRKSGRALLPGTRAGTRGTRARSPDARLAVDTSASMPALPGFPIISGFHSPMRVPSRASAGPPTLDGLAFPSGLPDATFMPDVIGLSRRFPSLPVPTLAHGSVQGLGGGAGGGGGGAGGTVSRAGMRSHGGPISPATRGTVAAAGRAVLQTTMRSPERPASSAYALGVEPSFLGAGESLMTLPSMIGSPVWRTT